ncbi:MAG TPA: tetratricopeptide repeat protein [Desulfomonilaceae bacterium]|nr:tetratricopeptide repeat protein [Desulfomonilaceae bacterium]
MKNLSPMETTGVFVPSNSAGNPVCRLSVFNTCGTVSDNSIQKNVWRPHRLLPNGNLLHGLIYTIVILVCMSLAVSIPTIALGQQQIAPELKEALEYHKAGKLKDAIEVYTEYLTKNPRSFEALNWRGMAYEDLNELDKALEDYNKAIEIKPDYADAYNNRGEVYRKETKFREAIGDFRKAVELDKKFPEAHYNMALALEALKNNERAITEYNAYLKLQPNATDKQQVTEKIEALQKLVAASPARPSPAGGEKKPGERPGVKKAEKPGVPKPGIKGSGQEPQPVIPGLSPGSLEAIPGLGLLLGLGMFILILPLLLYIFYVVMLYLIAKKTATEPAWFAFIPIANAYLSVKISGKPIWWLALLLLPIVAPVLGFVDPTVGSLFSVAASLASLVAWFFISLGIAAARGKSMVWGILLFLPCTSLVALGYLGLSE